MKTTLLSLMLSLIITFAYGQGMKIKVNKTEINVGDTINVEFNSTIDYDSAATADLSFFFIYNGPVKNTSLNYLNGKKTSKNTITYKLIGYKPGETKLTAPAIYMHGKAIKGEHVTIKVNGDNVSKEKLQELEYNKFIRYGGANGAVRVTFKNDMGFIERCSEGEWKFERRLKEEEIKELEKGALK